MNRHRILMICYYFPPLLDVACKRSVAFSKYFKRFGWEPYVVTVRNPDKSYCLIGNDKPPEAIDTYLTYSIANVYGFFGKLNGLLARSLKLFGIQLKRNFFCDLFCIPDVFFGWIPLTARNCFKIIRKENVDIIYASCPPFSSAIIGYILKRITRKHLVVDFRDMYAVEIPSLRKSFKKPRLRQKVDSWIEAKIVKHADIILVTSNEMGEAYKAKYNFSLQNVFTIYNGFETDLLTAVPDEPKFHRFTISYGGNPYLQTNGLDHFFEALSFLKTKDVICESNFQFLYYGNWSDTIEMIAETYNISDLVHAKPQISHEQFLRTIRKSHLQLLRIIKPMISTKLFEGIALNVPLLAIIPKGEVQEIIMTFSPSSYVLSSSSSVDIALAIINARIRYRHSGILDNHMHDFLVAFSRENLTRRLLKILEEYLFLSRSQKTLSEERRTGNG